MKRLAVIAGTAAISIVFILRFEPSRLLLAESVPPAIAALIVLLAALGCGRFALRVVRSVDAPLSDVLLIGFATFGTLSAALALMSTAFVPPFAITLAGIEAFFLGRDRVRFAWPHLHPLLAIAIGIAFIAAIVPVNSPDELVYKLSIPHAWQLYGRMIELPLNSHSYLAMALQCADIAALALGGGIAAKLAHFGIYVAVIAVVRRIGGDWAAIALAFTPALMIIAGWAWSEWGVLGLLLVSYDRWSRDDANGGACALGCAIASKYTALPWLLAVLVIALSSRALGRNPDGWTARKDIAPPLFPRSSLTLGATLRPLIIIAAFGAFFYVRNVIWTGSPIAPLLLPHAPQVSDYRGSAWLGVIRGDDIFDARIVDESLGIILPLAFIAGLFAWRRRRDLVLIGLIQMPILLTIGPGSRNIINGVAPIAIAGMSLLEEMMPLGVVFAIPLVAQLTLVSFTLESYDFLPYLAGRENATQYIARTRSFAQPYDWIARHTPRDARVLVLAENRTFYLQRRFVAAGNLDSERVNAWLAGGALDREHFTHIIIHKSWYQVGTRPVGTIEKEYVLQVTPATHQKVMQFLAGRAKLQYQDAQHVIYECAK